MARMDFMMPDGNRGAAREKRKKKGGIEAA